MIKLLQLSVSSVIMRDPTPIFCTIKNKHREEALSCSLCEDFFSKANLNRHMLTKHKDLALVSCLVCYKGFSRKDVMKCHMKAVHFTTSATKEKLSKEEFPCDFCKKKFCTLQNLKRHQKMFISSSVTLGLKIRTTYQ